MAPMSKGVSIKVRLNPGEYTLLDGEPGKAYNLTIRNMDLHTAAIFALFRPPAGSIKYEKKLNGGNSESLDIGGVGQEDLLILNSRQGETNSKPKIEISWKPKLE